MEKGCTIFRDSFSVAKDLGEIPMGSPWWDIKFKWGKIGDFRSISRYIWETVQDRDYRKMIGTRMLSIEWCYFQWPWVALTTPNHPIFHILYRHSYLRNRVDRDLLAQITNRKWCLTHRIAAITMTLSDLQGQSHTVCLFICFVTDVQHLTRFQLTVSRAVPLR